MKITNFILLPLLALFIAGVGLRAADYPLAANDSLQVAMFLSAPSAVLGQSNGQQLNSDFDAANPETWQGFTWTNDDATESRHLRLVDIPSSNLKGSLDLTGCTHITSISCEHNALDSIIIPDSKSLEELYCMNNKLHKLDLSGFTKLTTLRCERNNISQLDIRNSNELETLRADSNNLTFTGLNMPLAPTASKAFWNIGRQKLYLPKEIKIFGNADYVSEGNKIDLSYLGGKEGTAFKWRRDGSNTAISADMISTTGQFGDVFEFLDDVVNSKIYCVITNTTTHYNLEIVTVPFELSYTYNINDIERIRTFLEKPSVELITTNGVAVNPTYTPNDPRSFAVRWEPKDAEAGGKEMRVVWINEWDEKGLAGELNLSGCEYLDRIIVKNNAITDIVFGTETKYLTLLDCSNNLLTQLDATKHPQLINLLVAQNQLTTLDISNNDMLSYLDCSGNKLGSLTLASLPNLKEIHCNGNEIKALSVELLENIERLMCDNNLIAELKTDNLAKMQILSANNNLIERINLNEAKDLTSIYINNNKLSALHLGSLSKVNFLECSHNQLNFSSLTLPQGFSLIPPNNILLYPQDTIARELFATLGGGYISKGIQIDLSEYICPNDDYNTKFTWKTYDSITSESTPIGDPIMNDGNFTVPTELEGQAIYCELTCSLFKNLTLVTPVFKATYQYAEAEQNALQKFLDAYSKFGNEQNGKTNGKVLSASYVPSDPTTYPNVEWAVVDGVKRVKSIDWSNQVELKGELDLTGCAAMESINLACHSNLERNDISKLILNECENVKTVLADYNQLETLAVLNCRNLVLLSASNNKLATSISVVSPVVEKIDLSGNKLSFVWVNNSPALKTINVSNNLIEEINLEQNSALLNLYCSDNLLKQLDLTNLVNLKQLDFSNNKVTAIDLSKQAGLSLLYCSNNLLTELNIKHCIELVAVRCGYNMLTKLDLAGIDYLTHLQASGNNLVFTSIEYGKIPNELQLNPQTNIRPTNIDEKHILTNDSLNLIEYAERADSDTYYTLRYLDGSAVDRSLYTELGGIVAGFAPELSDKTMFCEMTNSRYPGLVLRTTSFNTVPPMRYNYNDSVKVRAFLEQTSKTAGVTNGQYLSTNYSPDDPTTWQVTWVAVDSEFHLRKITWNVKPNFKGNLNLEGCNMLDTIMVTGMDAANTGLVSINLKGCTALSVIDMSYNSLTSLDLSSNTALSIIFVAHNNISFIDVSHLTNVEILDVIDNALLFGTLRTGTPAPTVIAWEPQKRITPADLIMDGGAYKLKSPTISLSYLGASLGYVWRNSKNAVLTLEQQGGVFTVPASLSGEVLNCTITSTAGVTAGLTLRTIDFLVDNNPTSIAQQAAAATLLYPNPASDAIFVDINGLEALLPAAPAATLTIDLYDMAGKWIANCYNGLPAATAAAAAIEIPLERYNLTPGSYYLQIGAGGIVFAMPISVNK